MKERHIHIIVEKTNREIEREKTDKVKESRRKQKREEKIKG